MKIVRLELFGFKSFKDRTVVTFNQPITAIVGSNGCGKSNVVDALYWVMGDMSPKHLRGSSMTDVIFSGSRDTAPLDMAEVTLVLERDPGKDPELPPQFQASNEIQITRRYFRSGDSEYLINRVSCRLRDIQEFFMDTGVGVKAYSIVEQGAITRMISLKPEDRRSIIEEVAGIMKFKARKAETERKIDNSRLNLQRIDDIVQDLQKQLGSLKRQADKAEKFKSLSDQLKNLEIRLATREWLERTGNKSQSLVECEALKSEVLKIEERIQSEKARAVEMETTLAQLETELHAKREESRQVELALKDLESTAAAQKSKKEALGHRLDSNRHTLEGIAERELVLEKDIKVITEEISRVDEESHLANRELDKAEEEVTTLAEQVEELRSHVGTDRKELHSEEIQQTRLAQQMQGYQRQIAQLESKRESIAEQLVHIESELNLRTAEQQSTLKGLEMAFATRSELETAKVAVDEELAGLENEKVQLQASRDQFKQDLARVQIRKEQLEALERDLDGVDSAAKSLALHMRDSGQEKPLLADVIQVPELLEKAVEAVLGRNLQRIIASDMQSVEELRNVLVDAPDNKAKQSRAPLWIPGRMSSELSSVEELASIYLSQDGTGQESEVPGPDGLVSTQKTQALTAQAFLLNHPEVVGPLDRLIDQEETANVAWLPLVRDFWVLRSREALLELATTLAKLPLNFVTLDGDVLYKNGFLDLAPVEPVKDEATTGLIHRKRVIADLKIEESKLSDELTEEQSKLETCQQSIAQAKEKFRELTGRLAALNPDVERHSVFLRQVESQIARLTEKTEILGRDQESAKNESLDISAKLEEITEQLSAAEMRREALTTRVHDQEAQLKVQVELHGNRNRELNDLRVQSKKLDREMADFQSRRAATEQEKSLQATRQVQVGEENERIESQVTELLTQLEEGSIQQSAKTMELRQSRDIEEELSSSVQGKRSLLREIQTELENVAERGQSLTAKIRDLEQHVAIHDVELKNISEKVENQYQIALVELESQKLEELSSPSDIEEAADPEAGRRLASQLRSKIDNLGRINMVAVEEFEDLRRRHEYLYIQREDLSEGLRQLREAIDRIDRESKERFTEAYVAVNEAFQKTFPILFGGGNAELRLTDPNNMLETGVEIVAQPPGKKLQSVTLLSGGEKALTAVSLIFGIFSIKPSPFCVLDEVDAPLDDANVGRFNNLVRKITLTSQVIMITHHKKTMESCDALFGVTMERPGISKVASVRLAELKDEFRG